MAFPQDQPRQIVLCFDGTGNTFRTDGYETNILKIFRMLDRNYYYQPGIGTKITPSALASTAFRRRKKPWKNRALDQALGYSFDQHVIGGYRYLMRHCRTRDDVYIFGFSRGAYTARFLNEMVDHVGLLGVDNEEMIPFIWEAFATWRLCDRREVKEREAAFGFLKVARETICRPINRVQFLGLFDTVNSIPEFQVDTGIMPTARVIRHAVSIDERRVKFQPVLLEPGGATVPQNGDESVPPGIAVHDADVEYRRPVSPNLMRPPILVSTESSHSEVSIKSSGADTVSNHDTVRVCSNIQEVWFPGGHGDIGGGWPLKKGEQYPLSHSPLVWMIQEAQRSGLQFDPRKMSYFKCMDFYYGSNKSVNSDVATDRGGASSASMKFYDALHSSSLSTIHDTLEFGQGRSGASVWSWRILEYFPFSWMGMQPDGSWKLRHWPLHRGQRRDIPIDAKLHVAAIRRMEADESYKPANLIIGSGSRGLKRAPEKYGMGKWKIDDFAGDAVRETYVRCP